jgi:ubiquinone/menaquinone biosynthesis C-methylase UbiE
VDNGVFDATGMWDELAPAWDKRGDWHRAVTAPLTTAMIDALAPAPGQTVLEVACGPTADGVREVERRLPGQCRLIASDLSPAMLQTAQARAARDGIPIGFQRQDAAALTFETGSIDGVVARWVYMLLPDPAQGLTEARRVLRRGGRCAFAVFDRPDRNPIFTLPAAVLVERGHLEMPKPGQPSMFALADRARIRDLVISSGFDQPAITEVDLSYRFDDSDDLWSYLMEFSGPVTVALRQLDDHTRVAIRAEVERRAAQFADGAGYALPAVALVISGAAASSSH